MKNNKHYAELLHYASKVAFHSHEAEDLLQTALLAAIENGRADLSCLENRKWLIGTIRNQSAFCARSAARRQKREASVAYLNETETESAVATSDFINTLPASLKTTALLALTGHTKVEIAWLLRITDAALRQRIVQIKRRWRLFDGRQVLELGGLSAELPFGLIRQSLLKAPIRDGATLGTHDPDGHLFIVSSQNATSRQHRVVTTQNKEKDHAK